MPKRFLLVYVLLRVGFLGLLLFPASSVSQGKLANKESVRDLYSFLDTALKPIVAINNQGSIQQMSRLYTTALSDTNTLAHYKAKVIEAKMKKVASDYSLSLRIDYLENLDDGAFPQRGGSFYKRRGLIGLRWDVLKDGILESKHKAQALKDKLKLYKLKQANKKQNHEFSLMFNRIINTFNKAKLRQLKRRKRLLKKQLKIDRQRFQNNQILYEEVINTKSKLRETEQMTANVKQYNNNVNPKVPSPVKAKALPILDIYLDSVLADIKEPSRADSILELKRNIQKQKIHPATEISLTPYVRNNIYYSSDENNTEISEDQSGVRQFYSWGLSFQLPLKPDEDPERNLQKARLDRAKSKIKAQKEVKTKQALNTYYEYQYALNDYIEFYHKKAALTEKVRQQQARRRINDQSHSPVRMLRYGLQIAEVNFELADLQQRMYIKLLNLQQHLTTRSLEDVVNKHPVKDQVERFQSKRSMYIWSDAFLNHPNTQLISLLNVNQVGRVMLSLGKNNQALPKAKRFIRQAKKNQIGVALMVGNNQLYQPANHQKLSALVQEAVELGVDALHLDVEPHALDQWDNARLEMQDDYLTMTQKARKLSAAEGLQLGLSVPIWYDARLLEKLYKNCDRLTLMAYERTEVLRLEKSLKQIKDSYSNKTVVALRPADFGSMPTFYKFMKNLNSKTKIGRFAIHDLGSLQKLKKN
jgi:hypothetical protein